MPLRKYYILALLIISLAACHKGSDDPCEGTDMTPVTYPITAEDEAKIKYEGHDTLRFQRFIDSVLVDTVTLIGQGRVYDTIFLGSQPPTVCKPDEYAQQFSILYKADKVGLDFSYIVHGNPVGSNFITKFQGQILEDLFWSVNAKWYGGYYPYMYVNGKDYYNVNIFSKRGDCNCFYLYYTVNEGIIRIELKPHEAWQLID